MVIMDSLTNRSRGDIIETISPVVVKQLLEGLNSAGTTIKNERLS